MAPHPGLPKMNRRASFQESALGFSPWHPIQYLLADFAGFSRRVRRNHDLCSAYRRHVRLDLIAFAVGISSPAAAGCPV
jgi:hypothetical protein